jgi:ParB/RepB/Spo0J family partition protein
MRITPAVVEHADLLHALEGDIPEKRSDFAAQVGRDPSNLNKHLKRLADEGLVAAGGDLALTDDGRALTRLIGPDGTVLAPGDMIALRVDQIEFDPENEREAEDIDQDGLAALSESILVRGLKQNLVVTPPAEAGAPFMLVIGERRLRAIRLAADAGRWAADTPISCKLEAPLSPIERAFARMTENLQREDLHPLAEGAGYLRLREKNVGDDEIAAGVSRSKKHVQDRINMVLKLDDDAKRRMRLSPDHPDHLGVKAARSLMQEHRPKPKIDVTNKEALVLLEVTARQASRPSRHPGFPAAAGWTEVPQAPAGGAASSLVAKGLLDIVENESGVGAIVRLARNPDLEQWMANRIVTGFASALYSARSEILGAFAAAEHERDNTYATTWLNPPPSSPAAPAAGSVIPEPAEPRADENGGEPGTGGSASAERDGEGRPSFSDELGRLIDKHGEAANPVPAAAAVEAPTLTLPAERQTMAEIAHAIEHAPEGGPRDNAGRPHYIGTRAWPGYRADDVAFSLIQARLIKLQPDGRRTGDLACLTPAGEAWAAANRDLIDAVEDYRTPWLKPPVPEPSGATAAKPTAKSGVPIGDDFSRQLREAAEAADEGEERETLRPDVSDTSLAGQLAWLRWMAPSDPAVINICEDDELPLMRALIASLQTLEAAYAHPNRGFVDLLEAIRDRAAREAQSSEAPAGSEVG